jgi:hypothetical protein
MFVLKYACVHYGVRSYPMNNLPSSLQKVRSVEDVRPEVLTQYVGRAYGFPREFTIRHDGPQSIPTDGDPLCIPELIVATANGYSFIWHKEQDA